MAVNDTQGWSLSLTPDMNITADSVKWLVNPYDLDATTWFGTLMVKQCGILIWDAVRDFSLLRPGLACDWV